MDKREKSIQFSAKPEIVTNGEININDIPVQVVNRYNLKVGAITPFSQMKIVG